MKSEAAVVLVFFFQTSSSKSSACNLRKNFFSRLFVLDFISVTAGTSVLEH